MEKNDNNDNNENSTKVGINWYPGHMTKARRMMEEEISLIDIIIEIIDARIPLSSRNPDIDTIGKNKARLIVMNKSDLADPEKNKRWMEYFRSRGFAVLMVNAAKGEGIRQIDNAVANVCRDRIERNKKRGIVNRPMRAMVVGIPNVGKSTFINSYVGKGCAKTGNKPGVTKGKQWIRLGKNIELLDTPGMLPPKIDDKDAAIKLALSGSIKDDILDTEGLAAELAILLDSMYPDAIKKRYNIEYDGVLDIFEKIAAARACRLKGDVPDTGRAAYILVDEFRSGKLGRITLELPVE